MSIDPKLTDSSGSPITSATVAQANKAPNLIAINVAAQALFKLNEWDMPLPTIKINMEIGTSPNPDHSLWI